MSDKFTYHPFSLHGDLIETVRYRADDEAAMIAAEIFCALEWEAPSVRQFYTKTEADFVFLEDYGLVMSFRHRHTATFASEKHFENAKKNKDDLILAPFVQAPMGENCLFELSPAIRTPVNFDDRDHLMNMLEARGFCLWDAQTDNAGYIQIPDTDVLLPVALDRGAVRKATPGYKEDFTDVCGQTYKGHDIHQVQYRLFGNFIEAAAQCWQADNPVPTNPSALKEFFKLAHYHAALDESHPDKKLFTSWQTPRPYDLLQAGIAQVARNYKARMPVYA